MQIDQVLALLNLPGQEQNIQVSNFQIDSRNISSGSLFFALKGNHVDGHHKLQEVKDRGATGAVVNISYKGPDWGLFLIRVDNVLEALQMMAKNRLKLMNNPIIVGITGSAGKTTTKEFTAHILSSSFKVGKNPRSFNSQITFPLNILNFPLDCQVLVLEMGVSAIGDMENLVKIAAPDIALITNLSTAHIGNFPEGFRGIVKEKSKIFSQDKTKQLLCSKEVAEHCKGSNIGQKKLIHFSTTREGEDYSLFLEDQRVYIQEKGKEPVWISSPFSESHLLEDVLMAVSIARTLGVSWSEISKQIQTLSSFEKRFEKIVIDGVLYIDDTYNASPDSVLLALKNLPKPSLGGKVICVLGEMRELGSFAEKAYDMVAKQALERADILYCYGEKTLPMVEAFCMKNKPAFLFFDKKEISLRLKQEAKKGDVVLVKGVNSQQLWDVISYLQKK